MVSLLLWGWIWGVAGAFLATPILILTQHVAAHIPRLRPLAVLLGEDRHGGPPTEVR
jgi:AI-2 transport protein TqsA